MKIEYWADFVLRLRGERGSEWLEAYIAKARFSSFEGSLGKHLKHWPSQRLISEAEAQHLAAGTQRPQRAAIGGGSNVRELWPTRDPFED